MKLKSTKTVDKSAPAVLAKKSGSLKKSGNSTPAVLSKKSGSAKKSVVAPKGGSVKKSSISPAAGVTKKSGSVKKSKEIKKVMKTVKKLPVPSPDTESESDNENAELSSHTDQLKRLKEIDPDFYEFLEKNDKKLLNFNIDDDLSPTADDGQDDDDDTHLPDGDMEVASDESDFVPSDEEEDDGDETATKSMKKSSKSSNVVTLKLLEQWQQELNSPHVSVDTIKMVVNAFNSALIHVSDDSSAVPIYKVEGSAAFNGVIQLCIIHLQPAIARYLDLVGKPFKQLHKCKRWSKVRTTLRNYFLDLTRIVERVASTNILSILLKHLHQMMPVLASFNTIAKPILKRLIQVWSTADDTVRVIAFLCILRLVQLHQSYLLATTLKAMYLAYVRNSKFVSPNTLSAINFMRRSLTELFALDPNTAYQHIFVYIRQLAIHLRTAMTIKKKESYQTVYNWQYINSLRLWVNVLVATVNKKQLQPLLYPLITIIIGVIKLIPTAQFFPLRFHCIQMLIHVSRETRVFVPVMPFLLEVLNSKTFNRKHTKASMRPILFTTILRCSKAQMTENGFRNEIVENVYGLLLEYLAYESFTISFPDLVVPCLTWMRQYLKKDCRNSNYSRKFKQLCEKIEENSRFIEDERRRINFTLRDQQLVASWQTSIQNRGTPMLTYYTNWQRTHELKMKREAANTDEINEFELPTMKKRTLDDDIDKKDKQKKIKKTADGKVELFPSDSEDENEEEEDDDDDDDDDGDDYEDEEDDGDEEEVMVFGDDDDDEEEIQVVQPPTKTKGNKSKKSKATKAVANHSGDAQPETADGGDIVKDIDPDDWN